MSEILNRIGPALLVFLLVLGKASGALAEEQKSAPATGVAPCASSATAKKQPPAWALVSAGVPMLVADFFVQDLFHEGSHCLAADALGARCTGISVIPHTNANGTLVLGETTWQGNLSTTATTMVLLAPKITDLTMLGGYTALLETGNLPKDKWGRLALTVVAAGAEIDLAKHFFWRNKDNDVETAYSINGITGAKRIPFEILYGSAILGGAIEVGRGFYSVFARVPKASSKSGELTKYGSPVIGMGSLGWKGTF